MLMKPPAPSVQRCSMTSVAPAPPVALFEALVLLVKFVGCSMEVANPPSRLGFFLDFFLGVFLLLLLSTPLYVFAII